VNEEEASSLDSLHEHDRNRPAGDQLTPEFKADRRMACQFADVKKKSRRKFWESPPAA
jgi:hypothetical protein